MISFKFFREQYNAMQIIFTNDAINDSYDAYNKIAERPSLSHLDFEKVYDEDFSTVMETCLTAYANSKEKWIDIIEAQIMNIDLLFCYADKISALYDNLLKKAFYHPALHKYQLEDGRVSSAFYNNEKKEFRMALDNVLYYDKTVEAYSLSLCFINVKTLSLSLRSGTNNDSSILHTECEQTGNNYFRMNIFLYDMEYSIEFSDIKVIKG